MLTANAIRTQISEITADLIAVGLCVDQNFPTMKTERDGSLTVSFGGLENLSVTLKNIPYAESYQELRLNRSYNLRLIDGGVIQMLYHFSHDKLVKHRLAFFPSPDLLEYQNNSEVYELDEMYGDVIASNIVTSPIRFDFDPTAFDDYHHPMSHLTIGQYKNCRIPVTGPLSPFSFMNFILRAFYNTPYKKFSSDVREHKGLFEATITGKEMRHLHVNVGLPQAAA